MVLRTGEQVAAIKCGLLAKAAADREDALGLRWTAVTWPKLIEDKCLHAVAFQ